MRRSATRAAVGLLVTLVAAVAPLASPIAAHSAQPATATDSALTVSVIDISPSWTPTPTATQRPLTITVLLQNTTDSVIDHVVLSAGRGTPVATQSELNDSLSDRTLADDLLPFAAHGTSHSGIDVPAGGTVQAAFRTTTTTSAPCQVVCLYADAVYPIYLSAYDSQSNTLEGFTRTYLAAVDGAPDKPGGKKLQRVGVAWLWPLIDAPHRLTGGRVFTDRTLLTSLAAPDGRLYRALQVVRVAGRNTPMTLLLDPELVDEVALLANGNYFYLSGSGHQIAGARVPAAQAWLTELRSVLAYSDITPEFTPYADPDIQSLSAGDLPWQTAVPPAMSARVERALGLPTIPSTLSWPPSGAVTQGTLNRIAGAGATRVLLDGTSVRPTNLHGLPTTSATLHTTHGPLSAALTSPATQADVAASIRNNDPTNVSHLPTLLAELAIRADRKPYDTRVAFLTPPRYVDADPAAAETVIRQTTSSAFSRAASVEQALTAGVASGSAHARTRHASTSTPSLSPAILRAAHQLASGLPALRTLLMGKGATPGAAAMVTDLSRGLQRVESAAYLSSSSLSTPTDGSRLADRLQRQVSRLLNGVHIVRPAPGHHGFSYTLASENSPLPITVDNTLPYRAFVHITVATVGGVPGLRTTDLGTQPIAPDSKQTFRVPAHVRRSGSIALTATLTTAGPHRYVLGSPVRLTVHSTVFGTVGVIITVVAALVLVLALTARYIRRIQRLRRKRRASAAGRPVPAKVG